MSKQKKHYDTAPEDRVSAGEKLAYGGASYADNLMQNSIGQMANPVFNISLGMNPVLLSLALALPRLWDALTDPYVGSLSDNARTRWGRRRPFIFVGAIMAGILFMLIWRVPVGWSDWGYFSWLLGFSLLFFTAYTVFAMPYIAMGFELSSDYHERTRVMAVRTFFGSVAGISIQWMFFFTQRNWFEDTLKGMQSISIWIGLGIIVLGVLPVFFIKDRNLDRVHKQDKVPFWRSLKEASSVPVFRVLLMALVAMVFGLFLVNSLGLYVNIYHVFGGDTKGASLLQGFCGSAYHVSCMMALPLVSKASSRFGKRTTLFFSLSIALVGTASKWWCYTPENPYLQLIPFILMGPGIAALWTILGSMVADICDVDELQYGARREGMFSAIYGWVFKLGLTSALAVSGFVLVWTGFDANLGGAQDLGVILRLRVWYSLLPAIGIITAMLLMTRYDLTEDMVYSIRDELRARRSE